MKLHEVKVVPAGERLPKQDQLAWKIAAIAADPASLDGDVAEMVVNRIIDVTACAIAALNRAPVVAARAQALAHPRADGAALFGLAPQRRFDCAWAAWANACAIRELDFNDSFFSTESSHPGDTIGPLVAVAQQCRASGADLLRGIATAYEIQIDLGKGIPLNKHRIDHVAHLSPAVAAGIGAMLKLDVEMIYQAVQQAAHVATSTRQSRKGAISSWKGQAAAHVGKCAIEAIDRAMRGQTAPSPVYEGDYGIIAVLLDGPDARYEVPLPERGESRRAILESYPKEHSAGYHGQALIDLAFRMRAKIDDFDAVERIDIHSKHLTHLVMGSGSGDSEKYDPKASRETLDHSAMFIFAVALQDGVWHHETSYASKRVARPDTVALWRKVRTLEDESWNRRFLEPPPLEKDHGARVVIALKDGTRIEDEIAVANAHPRGAKPFAREDYVRKFETLALGLVEDAEIARFLKLCSRLQSAGPEDVAALLPAVPQGRLAASQREGLFG